MVRSVGRRWHSDHDDLTPTCQYQLDENRHRGDHLLIGLVFVDNLLGARQISFHGGVHYRAWPNEVSHPLWSD